MVPKEQVQKLCANSTIILNIRLVCNNWNLDRKFETYITKDTILEGTFGDCTHCTTCIRISHKNEYDKSIKIILKQLQLAV